MRAAAYGYRVDTLGSNALGATLRTVAWNDSGAVRRACASSLVSFGVTARQLEFDPPNGSLTQLRRGPGRQRQSGAPFAATNVKTAGTVCKRRDAVPLARKEGLQPRAGERPAVGCSEKLGRDPANARSSRRARSTLCGKRKWRRGTTDVPLIRQLVPANRRQAL